VHQLRFLFTLPECSAPVRSSSPRSLLWDPCSHELVRRALRRSVFSVRFSVIILIQLEQAPDGFCSFLCLGNRSPQSNFFPSLIRSSKTMPLFAVECQTLVRTEPFPNSVLPVSSSSLKEFHFSLPLPSEILPLSSDPVRLREQITRPDSWFT
jgi:hypothetical protein